MPATLNGKFAYDGTAGSATSFTPSLDAATATGDTILVWVNASNGTTNIASVSGCGATWTQLLRDHYASNGVCFALWAGVNATAGNTGVTVNLTVSGQIIAIGLAFSTVATSGTPTGASIKGPTATLASPVESAISGQVVVDFGGYFGGTVSSVTDTPGAFTTVYSDVLSTATFGSRMTAAYRIAAETASEKRTWNLSTTPTDTAAAATLLPAAPLPLPPRQPYTVRQAVTRAAVI